MVILIREKRKGPMTLQDTSSGTALTAVEIGCGFLQVVLLAAFINGQGPEDGDRSAICRGLSCMHDKQLPCVPFSKRRVELGSHRESVSDTGLRGALLPHLGLRRVSGWQGGRVSSRGHYQDCLMLSAFGKTHVPSLSLGVFVCCTMRSADGYRLS